MKIGLFITQCKNIFQNGCFQQSYFILKALLQSKVHIRLYSVQGEETNFQMTDTTIYPIKTIDDVKHLDLMLFVSGILNDNDFLQKMKSYNIRLVHVICGNWSCLFQEELCHNVHNRATSAFNQEIDEYWLLPMYRFMTSFISTITHKNVYIAPYVWDEEIIQARCTLEGIDIHYRYDKTDNHTITNILIMEPNMSIHKTGLIPLLICERLYVEMGIKNIKVLFFCKNSHQGFIDIISKLTIFKEGKIELYDRMETPVILSQLKDKNEKIVVVSHQTKNILNFLHLEMYHYGYPIIHNCPPYESMGYYYKDDDIVDGARELSYAINHHKEVLPLYKERAKHLLYKYHFTNPEVYQTWKRMSVETICRGKKG